MIANILLYTLVGVFGFFFFAGLIVSAIDSRNGGKPVWLFSFACGFIALMLARWGGI